MEITTAANIFWELPSYAFMKCLLPMIVFDIIVLWWSDRRNIARLSKVNKWLISFVGVSNIPKLTDSFEAFVNICHSKNSLDYQMTLFRYQTHSNTMMTNWWDLSETSNQLNAHINIHNFKGLKYTHGTYTTVSPGMKNVAVFIGQRLIVFILSTYILHW